MFPLPASTSAFGTINGLDIKKTLRLAVVAFLGAFCVKVAGAGHLTDANLQSVLSDGTQAGITALGGAAVELFRRFLTDHTAQ